MVVNNGTENNNKKTLCFFQKLLLPLILSVGAIAKVTRDFSQDYYMNQPEQDLRSETWTIE